MDQIFYVVQAFSRDDAGGLAWDPPAWSKNRSFAVSLTQALARRKAGVIGVAVAFDGSGAPAMEAEIFGSYGRVPTALFLQSLAGHTSAVAFQPAPAARRRA